MKGKITSFLIFLGLLVIWQLVATFVGEPKLFPTIGYLFKVSLPSIANFGDDTVPNGFTVIKVLSYHLGLSLSRIAVGLLVGLFMGFAYGLIIHYFANFATGSKILLKIARSVPLLALIPLFLSWFGGTEMGIFLYNAFAIFVIVATNTYEAVLNVPPLYKENATMLGANHWAVFRDIVIPAILAELYGSLKYIIGIVWAISLASEYLSSSAGMGFLIYQSYSFADMGKLIIFSSIYCLISIFSYLLLNLLAVKSLKWK